jgi:hypothetical protein
VPKQDNRSAPDGATLYYIRCTVEDAGHSALWWRPDGNGYTDKLDEAGKYTSEDVRSWISSRDVAIPVDVADGMAVKVVPARMVNAYQMRAKRDGEASP